MVRFLVMNSNPRQSEVFLSARARAHALGLLRACAIRSLVVLVLVTAAILFAAGCGSSDEEGKKGQGEVPDWNIDEPEPECWDESVCDGFECERTGIEGCDLWCGCRDLGQACDFDGICEDREARGTSCPSCSLMLKVLSVRHTEDEVGLGGPGFGRVEEVELAVEYAPVDRQTQKDEERARMADVSIFAGREVVITDVQPGEALMAFSKELFVDPKTGLPYQRIDSPTDPPEFRFLLASLVNTERLRPGRLFTAPPRGTTALVLPGRTGGLCCGLHL